MEGLFGFLHESSRKYPEKTFVQSGNRAWTYREVEVMVRKVSGILLAHGLQKGDRVLIYCENSLQYIAALFGIFRISAIAVPVNPVKTAEQLEYMIEKCTPKRIIACNSTIGRLSTAGQGLLTEIINIDSLDLWEYAGTDITSDTGGRDFTVDERDVAVILFTSGTTAFPKGVTLTHGNLIANTAAIAEYLQLTSCDSVLMTLPFTYSYGNSVLLTHTYAGASIVIENNTAYPFKILESIKKHSVTGFSTVGSYMRMMLKSMKNQGADPNGFGSLRYITFAGEAVHHEDISYIRENYPGLAVFVMYGMTEASARLSYLSPALLPHKAGSIGKGLSNVELKVINGSGVQVKPGDIGEVIARGPNIMKCYWNDPEATKEVLKDGWLYTGDYAVTDEDGYIYLKGRKTDMLKHMGHRISPEEIEYVVNRCDCVKESAVVECTLEGVTVIKAFIVPEKECTEEEIKKHVYPRLPVYMRPQAFEFINRLPRTDTGKIMRKGLRQTECVE